MFTRFIIFSLLAFSIFSTPLFSTRYVMARPNKYYSISLNITNSTNNTNHANPVNKNETNKNSTNYNYKTNNTGIQIYNVTGLLYEYKKNQTLFIILNSIIYPKMFRNMTLRAKNDSKLYFPDSFCYNYKDDNNYTDIIACNIDLSLVPKGDYLIEFFIYNYTIIYDRSTTIKILGENKPDNKTQNIELLYIDSNIYEKSNNQNVTLIFKNNNTYPKLIKGLTIYKNRNITFYVPLTCKDRGLNNSILCLANFSSIESGKYFVMYLEYNYKFINITRNISLNIYPKSKPIEDDLRLLKIIGEAYNNKPILLNLVFNKNVDVKYFSRFSLYDVRPESSIMYQPWFTFKSQGSNSSNVECYFNFSRMNAGTYYLGFTYQNKTYATNVTIIIKEYEETDSELLNIYSNFKCNITNQIAYFVLSGKRKTNLLYVIFSNGAVIQPYDCKIVNDDYSKYDLRCNVDLLNVNPGKLDVFAYYINGKHYQTNKNITVFVQ